MKQIFTFGEGQHHAGCFVEIEGEDRADCRVKMLRAFGTKFAFQYESRKAAGVDRWGLTEIDLGGNVVKTTYLVPNEPGRTQHYLEGNAPMCRVKLKRDGYHLSHDFDAVNGKLCVNCQMRKNGTGFGRTGVKP